MKKVLHIITGLEQGGAEAVLYRLIRKRETAHLPFVISFIGEGFYGSKLRAIDIPVYTLDMPRGVITVKGIMKLLNLIRTIKPDLVITWMYHANLLGGIISRLLGHRRIIWGIHHFNLEKDKISSKTRFVAKISSFLSKWVPETIIICSYRAVKVHTDLGYYPSKIRVIPNGYDLSEFKPDLEAREKLRKAYDIRPDELLIGIVARWDPQKDHENFIQATRLLEARSEDFRYIMVGPGINEDNSRLVDLIDNNEMSGKILLLGPRSDISSVFNMIDIHVLSSIGEAFPNTVAESMACGTPCVVTDVGDSAYIVGDSGWVVRPSDHVELSGAISQAALTIRRKGRDELGIKCRKRIESLFSVEKMVRSYESLFDIK